MLLEFAVAVDILEKEDLIDMGLVSVETGNFLVKEAGDFVSESPAKKQITEIIVHFYQYLLVVRH